MSSATYIPPPHPVMGVPTPAESLVLGEAKWTEAMTLRAQAIREEADAPLWKLWEPPIWRVCDALWGAPWLNAVAAEAIRADLGFRHPVNTLLLNGGWASGKTEYAANRVSRLMQRTAGGLCWCFHETLGISRDQQQPVIWKYLPPGLKTGREVRSAVTYVAYKMKTGFSEENFVLPNGTKCRFLTYEGGVEKLQGPTVPIAWLEELMGPEFIEAVRSRVARANGVMFLTFAPVEGYSPTMQTFWDGAQLCRDRTAYLFPMDGGPPDVARYLGLTEGELASLRDWLQRKQKPPHYYGPWSRPQDCAAWLRGETGDSAPEPGRRFKRVARVVKPSDPEELTAIVCFHGSDNPYGLPLSIYMQYANVSEELAGRYFYGIAKKGQTRKFPKFDRKVHVIADAAVPRDGTNYCFIDPTDGGRNWFLTWVRVTPAAAYVYREWPGSYEIPGLGVPGPWALPDGKLGDGRPGPGQDGFGWGLADYKREIARLERWRDYEKAENEESGATETRKDAIRAWDAAAGSAEAVLRRFVDSRFASTPHVENDRPVTLAENLAGIGLPCELTPGDEIAEGVGLINDRLSYDDLRPVDALNCPTLFVAASCKNTIFALETWRNSEKGRGACKDPIDNLRYFVLENPGCVRAEDYATRGGGHY
jgi:phage terminase large subunit-like protein